MIFPRAVIGSPAEFPADTFDATVVADGSAAAGAGDVEPLDVGVAAVPADFPPRLLT